METPITWLEKNLLIITTIVDRRVEMENNGSTFTDEETDYYLFLVQKKDEYEKSIALIRAAGIE